MKFGQKLLIFVLGSMIVDGIYIAIGNAIAAMDKKNYADPTETKVDRKGFVHLKNDDYVVE